jgi:hypothetical protein
VADVSHHLVSSDDATPLDCVTRFGPEAELQRHVTTVHTPGRTEYERRLHPVTRSNNRSTYECKLARLLAQRFPPGQAPWPRGDGRVTGGDGGRPSPKPGSRASSSGPGERSEPR